MIQRKSFLGTGWGFPVTFYKKPVCTIRMVSEEEDIKECLTILLSTRPGERVMRPDFGINLEDALFEPINESLNTYIKDLIKKAILYYESRIDLKRIDILAEQALDGIFSVELDYVIRSTNSRFNFVYDYYLREATIIP